MDAVITAEECRRFMRSSSGIEKKLVDDMVSRVDSAIRRCLKQGLTRTSITVPSFFYGVPNFDRNEVTSRVRAVFDNNGFRIVDSKADFHTFEVSWEDDPP